MMLKMSGQGANAGIFDYSVDIKMLQEANNALIYQVANNYGVSAENFKMSAQSTSGFARKVANAALIRQRSKQLKMWRQFEQELFETIREVNNEFFMEQVPESAEFSIDFGEQSFDDDPAVVTDQWKQKVDAGVASILDWIRAENPDMRELDDEEVEQVLNDNLALRSKTRDRFNLGGLVNTLNTQNPEDDT
jgi:hypothetical protein